VPDAASPITSSSSARAARWAASLSLAVTALLAVAGLVLLVLSFSTVQSSIDLRGLRNVFAIETAVVGLIIVRRHPENAIGWLFCSLGLINGIESFVEEYAVYTLYTHPGALPYGDYAAWLRQWIWIVAIAHGPFLFLLFPDGRYHSRGWRLVGWGVLIGALLSSLARALDPTRVVGFPTVAPPIGLHGVGGFLTIIRVIGPVVMLASAFVAAAGLVGRLRRSSGVERRQLQWFSIPGIPIYIYLSLALVRAVFDIDFSTVMKPLYIVTLLLFPVTSAISFLRYHLYDVSLIVNRTMVYAAVTAILGVTYTVSVVLLQRFLTPFTGGSNIAIAASTLLAAALFHPLRDRVQQLVDKRFYRRQYDQARTVEDFSRRLREQVDLDALSRELQTVVADTVQPRYVSLWLRPRDDAQRRR
jgi:hypothetical protein